jgi:ABC-type spermidine/putrescine transport system permease subunit II
LVAVTVFAIAAGAAVVAPRTASVSAALADAGDDCGQSRYKETEHIKTFYEVNRL